MSLGFVKFEKVGVSPVGNGRKTRRNVSEKSRKFRKSRKYSKAEIVISITHTVETSTRESFRKGRAVEIEE